MVSWLVPELALTSPVTEPPMMVMVSLFVPNVTELIVPASLLRVRLLLPSPNVRFPLREPPLLTTAMSAPVLETMLSIPEKVTLPSVPLPAPLIERLFAEPSVPATQSESVPVPPSIVMVELEALLTVNLSVPPRPLTVSNPEKVVAVPLLTELVPAPVPVTVMV